MTDPAQRFSRQRVGVDTSVDRYHLPTTIPAMAPAASLAARPAPLLLPGRRCAATEVARDSSKTAVAVRDDMRELV